MADPWEDRGRAVWRQVIDHEARAGDLAGEWPDVLIRAIGEACRQAFMEGLAVGDARGYDDE